MIDLLRTRRSIRKYKKEVIDHRSLEIIKEALLRCPSSRSINHRTFIFVDDTGLLSGLSKVREHGSQFIKDAALGIIVCGDEIKSDVWVEDCAIASIVAQLTAHSLGAGKLLDSDQKQGPFQGNDSRRIYSGYLEYPQEFEGTIHHQYRSSC
jgi:nitroreductase